MRVRVRYSGRVQGVGFRATALSIAQRHPVTGWVRNEADGSVLMEIQGEATVVDRVMDDIRRAMGRNIRSAGANPVPETNGEPGFEITR